MRILWNEHRHAPVGPFKLNVGQFNAPEGEWYWEASTPGFCAAANYHMPSEAEAKKGAEDWTKDQLLKFLVDLGIHPAAAFDDTVKCEPCYGTGRWGPNGSEVHQPCGGYGRLPRP